MLFYSIAALFMATAALAAPAANDLKTCCCCNIREPAIVCRQRLPQDCICPAVACPKDAPTRWPDSPKPTTAVVKRAEETPVPTSKPCCCCSPGRGAIVCTIREPDEDQSCICPMVMCPPDAPTVTEEGPRETGN